MAIWVLALRLFHGLRAADEEGEYFDGKAITGFLLIIFLGIIVIFGILFKFVKGFYTLFMNIHRFFLLGILVVAVIHGAAITTIIIGSAFGFDLFVRIILMYKSTKRFEKPEYNLLGENYIKITIKKKKQI